MNLENLYIHTKAAIKFEGHGDPVAESLEWDEERDEPGEVGILVYREKWSDGSLRAIMARVADRLQGWEGECVSRYDRKNIMFVVDDGELLARVYFIPAGERFMVMVETA